MNMASMTDSRLSAIPGSYCFQHDRVYNNSRPQSIFQPPAHSPTPTTRTSQIPRPISRSSHTDYSRKRPRLDSNTSYFSRPTRASTNGQSVNSTPLNLDGSFDHVTFNNLASSTYSLDDCRIASPSPLANSEYRLAGGLDTPVASLEQGLEALAQDEEEKDYRFNRYTTTNTSRTTFSAESSGKLSEPLQTSLPSLNGDSRKRTRSPTKFSSSLSGWGIRSTAWALTGGLAGKVFNFCVNTAFGGFRAGGGQAYQMGINVPGLDGMSSYRSNNQLDAFSNNHGTISNPQGHYPDLGGFVDDYMSSPEARRKIHDHDSATQSSHRDTETWDRSAIKSDWQVIDQCSLNESGDEQSPVRKRSRASVAGNWQRPISGNTMYGDETNSGASYASPRSRASLGPGSHQQRTASTGLFQAVRRLKPSVATSRRATSYLPSPTPVSFGQKSPERPSSSASTSASNRRESHQSNTGLSPEVVNYKRKLKAREKEQDENLRRLNAQLRDMIREGREALGSRVEIEDEQRGFDFDEGYYEDGWK